jgi:hypothetical protein
MALIALGLIGGAVLLGIKTSLPLQLPIGIAGVGCIIGVANQKRFLQVLVAVTAIVGVVLVVKYST